MDNKSYELYHWGIKGMRWGVRRYQNKDGSLTPQGKQKLAEENKRLKADAEVLKNRKATKAKFDRVAAKRKALDEEKKALDEAEGHGKLKKLFSKKDKNAKGETAKKAPSEMSDKELKDAIERSRQEALYRQLNEKHPFMKKFVNEAVVPATVTAGKTALTDTLTKVFNHASEKLIGQHIDPEYAAKRTEDSLKRAVNIEQLKKSLDDWKSGKMPEKEQSFDEKKKQLEYERTLADKEYYDLKRQNDIAQERQRAANYARQSNNGNNSTNNTSKPNNDKGSNNTSKPKTDTDSQNNSKPKKDKGSNNTSKPKTDTNSQNSSASKNYETQSTHKSEPKTTSSTASAAKDAAYAARVMRDVIDSNFGSSTVRALPEPSVSKGKTSSASHMNDVVYDLVDKNGRVMKTWNG